MTPKFSEQQLPHKTYADGLKDAIVWLAMNCKEWKPEALAGELANDFAEHIAPDRVQNVSGDSGLAIHPDVLAKWLEEVNFGGTE